MRVGFTGTRDGLTGPQRAALRECLRVGGFAELHQGCCVGADAEAALEARAAHIDVKGHPPESGALVSETALGCCDEMHEPTPYLERNRRIVDACEVLIACPKGPEERRSGTWSTVRYARKVGRKVVIVWPSGVVTADGESTAGEIMPAVPDPDGEVD